jgi:hypothetical protein
LQYFLNQSISSTKFNHYDDFIHFIDPGFYVLMLCTGQTGKILTIQNLLHHEHRNHRGDRNVPGYRTTGHSSGSIYGQGL